MSSKSMNEDYPNQKQRYAICISQFTRKKKKSEGSMEPVKWDEKDVSRIIIE